MLSSGISYYFPIVHSFGERTVWYYSAEVVVSLAQEGMAVIRWEYYLFGRIFRIPTEFMEITEKSIYRQLKPWIFILLNFWFCFSLTCKSLTSLRSSQRLRIHAFITLCDPFMDNCLIGEDLVSNIWYRLIVQLLLLLLFVDFLSQHAFKSSQNFSFIRSIHIILGQFFNLKWEVI